MQRRDFFKVELTRKINILEDYSEIEYAYDNFYLVLDKKKDLYGLIKINFDFLEKDGLSKDFIVKEVIPCVYGKNSLISLINQSKNNNIPEENSKLKTYKRFNMGGYVDENEKIKIPLMYKKVFPFNEGLAAVKKDKFWWFIDSNNKVIIPFGYEYALSFQNGLAPVKYNGKWGFINQNNEVVIPFIYSKTDIFKYGFSLVKLDDEYYFINVKGERIINAIKEEMFIENIGDIPKNIQDIKILEYLGIIELPSETIIIKENNIDDYKKVIIDLEKNIFDSNVLSLQEEIVKKLKK